MFFRNNCNDFKLLRLSLILKSAHISFVILTSYCTENCSLQNHLHPHHLQLTRTSVYFHSIVEKLQFSILIKEMKLLSKPFQIWLMVCMIWLDMFKPKLKLHLCMAEFFKIVQIVNLNWNIYNNFSQWNLSWKCILQMFSILSYTNLKYYLCVNSRLS